MAYRRNTRHIIGSLLRKTLAHGDTYQRHRRRLDYKSFLDIQLELVKRITATESTIRRLKKRGNESLHEINQAKERRDLLKIIGSTIAWILLEFDRRYIRNFSEGFGPGFISGKRGLKLETLVLKAAFESKRRGAVLHDITNCLRVGDLSLIGPEGARPLEVKMTRRPNQRELRQIARGQNMLEFYAKGISTKVIPGWTTIQRTSKRRERHNWRQMCTVIEKAIRNGYGIIPVENCLIYSASTDKIPDNFRDKLDDAINRFKNPLFIYGFLRRQFELPNILPITCFEIPLKYKEKLLFGDVGFCVMLDVNSIRRILEKKGFQCRFPENRRQGILEVSAPQAKLGRMAVGWGLVNKLLYECMSVRTVVESTNEMLVDQSGKIQSLLGTSDKEIDVG